MSFFISYARADRDSYLDRFFDDLSAEVRAILGGAADQVCFLDRRSIEAGDQWELSLADALRTSRLCVAVCSQSYVNSSYCGKEYQVFRERRDAWLERNPGKGARVIFPVLWVPPLNGKLSEAITSLQYHHDDFPEPYATEGLRYLAKLDRFKDEYQQFVSKLARKLVEAESATPLPELEVLRPLAQVPSAFQVSLPAPGRPEPGDLGAVTFVFVVARRGEVQAVRTSLDGYHDQAAWFWRPFHPEAADTIGLLAQETASKLKLRYREVDLDQNLVDRLRDLERAKEAVIFITDAWTVRLKVYANAMRAYDEAMLANCAVLVPWNDADAETTAQQDALKQVLQMAFPRKFFLRPPSHQWDSIHSVKCLREELEKVISEVRMAVLRLADTQRKALSEELAGEARRQGLGLNTSPNVSGPVGSAR